MKQKIALLIGCLLISCAAVGCGNSDSSDSSKTESVVSEVKTSEKSETKTSVPEKVESSSDNSSKEAEKSEEESKKESEKESKTVSDNEESEEVIEATVDENGELVFDIGDPDDWEEDSENEFEDEDSEEEFETEDFISSYTLLMLSPDDFKSKESLPVNYIITSEAELNDFIENHSSDYALKVEYTGDSFIDKQSFVKRASDTIKYDLPVYDYLVIITDHSKSEEPDVGSGSVDGNSVTVDLWVTKPTSDADKAYSCIMIPVEKDFLKGKDLSVIKVDPPIEEDEADL